jgi:hypothetical protein
MKQQRKSSRYTAGEHPGIMRTARLLISFRGWDSAIIDQEEAGKTSVLMTTGTAPEDGMRAPISM